MHETTFYWCYLLGLLSDRCCTKYLNEIELSLMILSAIMINEVVLCTATFILNTTLQMLLY
jgi:hypothetical protein